MNIWEVIDKKLRWFMRHVEEDAIRSVPFHFKVDGAGDDIPWRKLRARVVLRHESGSVGKTQYAAFAAQGLRNQKTLGVRMIEARRMKLDEFHVRDPTAGAPCHCHSVSRRRIGIGGVEVDLAGATRGEHRMTRGNGYDSVLIDIEYVCAQATTIRHAYLGADNEIDSDMAFERVDVLMRPDEVGKRGLDSGARGIGSMNDSSVAVATFAR